MRSVIPGGFLAIVLLAGGLPAAAQDASQTVARDAPEVVRKEPCADAQGFTCVTLRMPLDHFSDTGRTIDVTYAFRPRDLKGPRRNSRARRGTFVNLTSTPGSGISSAGRYTHAFDESVRRNHDIVFIDQRGAQLSGDMSCPNAALRWHQAGSDPATSTATTGLGADAKAFVDACIAESGVDPSILPYLGTRQAAEDLELIRQHLDAEDLIVYGEGYGTRLAQGYAAAHPDRIEALVLDGAVDIDQGLFDHHDDQGAAFDAALEATLFDCSMQRVCASDMQALSGLRSWDELAAQLADGPLTFESHGGDGQTVTREFTAADLVDVSTAFLDDEYDRMLLQRAVAAASQGDPWYLSRLLDAALGVDPDTQQAIGDPSRSDGLYYAAECLDYAIPGTTPEERAETYLAAGRELGVDERRLGGLFYRDLPCAFWPAQPDSEERPGLLTDVPYPMLVLGATLDPATPWAGAQRIAKAAGTNARMIVVPGGPHVIYGRGEGCPDWPVQHFIVLGELSEPPRKICEGDVADDYQRLPRKDISAYEDGLLEAWHDLDREIHTSADFVYWDGQAPLEVGCRLEGTIRYIPAEFGTDLELEGCSFADGLAFTGTGRMDDDAGEFTLLVRPDDMDEPFRRYVRDQLQEYVWPYQGGFSSGCFCETFRDGSGYGPRFRSGEERRSRIIERMKERAARDRHHRRQPGEDDGS